MAFAIIHGVLRNLLPMDTEALLYILSVTASQIKLL
jgi:hypothetical protein